MIGSANRNKFLWRIYMRDKKTLIRLFVEAYLSGDTTDFWAIAQHLGIYYEVLELLEKEDIYEG